MSLAVSSAHHTPANCSAEVHVHTTAGGSGSPSPPEPPMPPDLRPAQRPLTLPSEVRLPGLLREVLTAEGGQGRDGRLLKQSRM